MSGKSQVLIAIAVFCGVALASGGDPVTITIPYEFITIARFAGFAGLLLTLREALPRLAARPVVQARAWLADEGETLDEAVVREERRDIVLADSAGPVEWIDHRPVTRETIRL
jgi:hypothetical protein